MAETDQTVLPYSVTHTIYLPITGALPMRVASSYSDMANPQAKMRLAHVKIWTWSSSIAPRMNQTRL